MSRTRSKKDHATPKARLSDLEAKARQAGVEVLALEAMARTADREAQAIQTESVATWAAGVRLRAAQARLKMARVTEALAEARAEAAVPEVLTPVRVQLAREAEFARALTFASRALGFVELLVPKRIANEELGDAAETILRLVEQRRPQWQVYLKVVTTIFWVLFNAFRTSGRRAAVRKTAKRKG